MAVVTKYPQIVTVSNYTPINWNNPDYLKANDSDIANTDSINKGGYSDGLNFSWFGFTLKSNARIDAIYAEWRDMVRHTDGGKLTSTELLWPFGVDEVLFSLQGNYDRGHAERKGRVTDIMTSRSVKFNNVVTPNTLNDDNFRISGFSIENKGPLACKFYSNYVRLRVEYTDPTYALSADVGGNVIGRQVSYTLTLRNTNNAHQGVAIPVSISIPSGLTLVSQSGNGTYNTSTGKWNAVLNSQRVATIKLVFNTTTAGNKTFTSSVDGFSTSLSRTLTVSNPSYTLQTSSNLFMNQGDNASFTVIVSTNSPSVSSVAVNVPLPAGVTFVSSSGHGSYNSSTGVWTAQLQSDSWAAIMTFTVTGATPGTYTMNISTTGASVQKQVIVVSSTVTEPYCAEHAFTKEVLDYLKDGEFYTLSGYVKVYDTVLTEIYPGDKNFTIAVVNGVEYRSNHPQYSIGSIEHVSLIFLYDESQPIKFRAYGQWLEITPANADFQIGGLDLRGIDDVFEGVILE